MRFLLFVLIIIFLSNCGVDTDSPLKEVNDTNSSTDSDDSNTSDDSDNSDDSDDSDNSDDSDDTDNLDEPNADQANSDFDTRSAEEDENACIINATYKNVLEDSSFDPTSTIDEEQGLAISSRLTYDPVTEKTRVKVYYPNLDGTVTSSYTSINDDDYRLDFDQSWISNSTNTVYVRTPQGIESNYYGCKRYTFSINSTSIVGQRVYRVNN